MLINGKDKQLNFEIVAPPSKSLYHRELIIRFLCGDRENLTPLPDDNEDIIATRACLLALFKGADENGEIVLDSRESGSTLRFMIPVASAFVFGGEKVLKNVTLVFKTKGRLFDRPIDELKAAMEPHGIVITKREADRTIAVTLASGFDRMTAGEYVIDGGVSSQYISGLLMALTMVSEKSSVRVTGELKSVHYIELTEDILKKYGAETVKEGNTYYPLTAGYSTGNAFGEGGPLKAVPEFKVEGDWSNGAFLLCLERHSDIRVSGLSAESRQGDRAILDYFKYLDEHKGEAGLTFECSDIPDIVPYMAVIAPFETKEITFTGVGRLRIKESDRLKAVREQLEAIGVRTEETEDSLKVFGYEETAPVSIELSSYHDHRMAMCAILMAVILKIKVELDDLECVRKSFPQLEAIVTEYLSE